MNKNIFLLLLCLVCLKCEAANCTFSMGGKKYDLSGLQAVMPRDGFVSTDGLIRMGMCGNNAKVCSGDDSFVAVFGDKALQNCVVMLAKWEDPVPVPLPVNVGVVPEGIQFKLQTGDTCPAVGSQLKYEVDVRLVCDKTTEFEPFWLDQIKAPCTFGATMRTKYACPSSGPEPPDPSSDWGINGTFAGNYTCTAAENDERCVQGGVLVQMRGNCDDQLVIIVFSKDYYYFYDTSFTICSKYLAMGNLTNIKNNNFGFTMAYQTRFQKWKLIATSEFTPYDGVFELEMAATNGDNLRNIIGDKRLKEIRKKTSN